MTQVQQPFIPNWDGFCLVQHSVISWDKVLNLNTNHVHRIDANSCEVSRLDEQLRSFWDLESLDICENGKKNNSVISQELLRFKMEDTCT